jgi:fumarate reductase flavoprotein subunit
MPNSARKEKTPMSSDEKKREGLTRRDFVKGATAAGAVGALVVSSACASLSPSKVESMPSLPPKWDKEADVLVVGAGGAGLAAAAEAAGKGAKVILMEKFPVVGGDTLRAGGLLLTAGTGLQKKAGIDYPVERYWEEQSSRDGIMRKYDPDVMKAVVMKGPETIEMLLRWGVKIMPPRKQTPLFHYVLPPYNLTGLINPMYEQARKLGVEVLLETSAQRLYTDRSGRVVGLEGRSKGGGMVNIKAKAVILATGHYTFNDQMVKRYSRFALPAEHYNDLPPGSAAGDGILMGKAVGSALEDMCAGCTLKFQPPVISLFLITDPVMMVTAQGKRFFNEDGGYDPGCRAMLKKKIPVSYFIFDNKVMGGAYKVSIRSGVEKGWIVQADTIDGLAKASGIDPQGLKQTVEKYNTYADQKTDPEFGRRSPLFRRVDEPPYFSWKCTVCRYKTEGGLMCNIKAQVIDNKTDQPIPGLYAAGVTSGSVSANILACISHGLIAGENAAAEKG